MLEWFQQVEAGLHGAPVLQALLAAVCTFVLEDPTTIGSGLLVSDGRMSYWAALIGLVCGISLGDIGLYMLGRLAEPKVRSWGFIDNERMNAIGAWFDSNVVGAVLASRFLPGMRLPTYTAAGILRVSPVKFMLTAVGSSVVWTIILLNLTIWLGEAVLDKVGAWKWPVGLGIVAMVVVVQWRAMRTARRKAEGVKEEGAERVFSHFELWNPYVFYFPVVLWYTLLTIRYRTPMLPTIANPDIYSSGLIMESKSEILSLVDRSHASWVAHWTTFVNPEDEVRRLPGALDAMTLAGIELPIVAKPDVGQRGDGVRPIRSETELAVYLRNFPPGETVILQDLAPFDEEAGVLYVRMPEECYGTIISVTLKEFPAVTGDGERTLRELIEADRRARRIRSIYFERFEDQLDRVVPDGERVQLVFAGNHCQGAVFRNGAHLGTDALTRRLDDIVSSMGEFYFGRFDIRFRDQESLGDGEHFAIIEINGASAEATHIWDPRTRLAEAYAALFEQFSLLFAIGLANRKRGFKPMSPWTFLRDVRRYRRLAKDYPKTS